MNGYNPFAAGVDAWSDKLNNITIHTAYRLKTIKVPRNNTKSQKNASVSINIHTFSDVMG